MSDVLPEILLRTGGSEDEVMADMIQRIDIDSTEYPHRLREIPDPPEALFCRGELSLLSEDSISVVGSRKYTLYGKTVAGMIGRRLGEYGIPVVSGLAYGIDAFAHKGALDAGGAVIGVLPCGLNNMAPAGNRSLMERGLETGGLMISEYEPDDHAEKWKYPRRNRIISGISCCTAVVEANMNSGSLITAQHAMEQGHPVFAVPGNINSQFSVGCNLLIRDGAYPLIVIDDLIRYLGHDAAVMTAEKSSLGDDERIVFDAVCRYNGASSDRISEDTGMPSSSVNAIVTIMEIKGLVRTYAGKIYVA